MGEIPPRPSRSEAPPPARSEQNTKEKFCFPFRRKNRARANPKIRTKLFFGVASGSERRRGGASVSFKEGSPARLRRKPYFNFACSSESFSVGEGKENF